MKRKEHSNCDSHETPHGHCDPQLALSGQVCLDQVWLDQDALQLNVGYKPRLALTDNNNTDNSSKPSPYHCFHAQIPI